MVSDTGLLRELDGDVGSRARDAVMSRLERSARVAERLLDRRHSAIAPA